MSERVQTISTLLRVILGALETLAIAAVVMTIIFVVFAALPSDPIRNALGVNASEAAVEALRAELGYDDPLPVRYGRFMLDVVTLDFGRSLTTGEAVRPAVLRALGVTMIHGAAALTFSALLSLLITAVTFLLGRNAAVIATICCRVLTSMPAIVLAVAVGVILHAMLGDIRAASSFSVPAVIAIAIYPTCSLSEIGIDIASRRRASIAVLAGRSNGFAGSHLLAWIVIPAIRTAWVGQLSNLAASIFVSSAVFEAVFSIHGVGGLLVRAITRNDLPIMQGVAAVVILAFVLVDACFETIVFRGTTLKAAFA